MLYLENVWNYIANMLYDTCELIIQDKRANDFKTLNLTWFVTFLSHHRLLRAFFKTDEIELRKVYKKL
jgi:hypothetical protein